MQTDAYDHDSRASSAAQAALVAEKVRGHFVVKKKNTKLLLGDFIARNIE